ncbi:MAG: hypothetical protein K8J08_08570 [Thermoanaerobaculia bacterium]|nr:hypothetical protein [Thermoanaerobaculia bacterium]
MPETTEIWILAVLSAVALFFAVWELRKGKPNSGRPASRAGQASGAHLVLATLAVFAYFGLGSFRAEGTFTHHWEQFHYTLGSKYFAELGYDGLYLASVRAQRVSDPERPRPAFIRDLRDNRMILTSSTEELSQTVVDRFSDSRWESFVADHHAVIAPVNDQILHSVRKDHGYNPTPTWTFIARLFTSRLPIGDVSMVLLGCLDVLLLGAAAFQVWRTYGPRTGCWFLILVALGYAWRFSWVGGGLLRQLWFTSLVFSACAAKTQRYSASGAFLALATMLRVFPAAFFLGPLVVALRDVKSHRSLGWLRHFALGAGLTVFLGLVVGSAIGRGPSAWPQFAANLEKHQATWLTNNVGLVVPLIYDVWDRRDQTPSSDLLDPGADWVQELDEVADRRLAARIVFALTLLLLAAGAAWKSPLDQAILLGPVAVFALAAVTSYYWIMLALVLLRPGLRWPLPTLFFVNLGACVLELRGIPLFRVYGIGSWTLLALFIAWTAHIASQSEGPREERTLTRPSLPATPNLEDPRSTPSI